MFLTMYAQDKKKITFKAIELTLTKVFLKYWSQPYPERWLFDSNTVVGRYDRVLDWFLRLVRALVRPVPVVSHVDRYVVAIGSFAEDFHGAFFSGFASVDGELGGPARHRLARLQSGAVRLDLRRKRINVYT